MRKGRQSCIFLAGGDYKLSKLGLNWVSDLFEVVHSVWVPRSFKEYEDKVFEKKADWIFNFLSPVILREDELRMGVRGAINFHPAPSKYPGVGGCSYAIYNRDGEFGVVCHEMAWKVDSGKILRSRRFPIGTDDTCEVIHGKAEVESFLLMQEVLSDIAKTGKKPKGNGEDWFCMAKTRADFERFMRVSHLEDPVEIVRKAKALRHSQFPGPWLEIGGVKFEVSPYREVIPRG